MNSLLKIILGCIFIGVSPVLAMQLTDVEGIVFNLNQEQLDAFKQCKIYTDYQDNIAKDEAAEHDIANQSKIWSFSDCTNTELKADYISKLMNCIIDSNNINTCNEKESGNLFALSLYMAAPEHKIQKLAEKYYDYFQQNKAQLQSHPNFKNYENLEKTAIKYLPYYPNMHAFIEDFSTCYIKNGHPDGWKDLISTAIKNGSPWSCLDLSSNNLQKLGFIKKIHSLDGIEQLANYLNLQDNAIICNAHKITDFKIASLQKIFPKLEGLFLNNNSITHLHKKQLKNISTDFSLFLDNNNITTIDQDYFSLINGKIILQINRVNKEQFQNIYFPTQELKNILLKTAVDFFPFVPSVPTGFLTYKTFNSLLSLLGKKLHIENKIYNVAKHALGVISGIYIYALAFKQVKVLGNFRLFSQSEKCKDLYYEHAHSIITCSNGHVKYFYTSDKPYFK